MGVSVSVRVQSGRDTRSGEFTRTHSTRSEYTGRSSGCVFRGGCTVLWPLDVIAAVGVIVARGGGAYSW